MIENLLNGTGTFKRLDPSIDAAGAPAARDEDFEDLYVNIPLRVDDIAGGIEVVFGQQVLIATHVVYCLIADAPGITNGDYLDTEGVRYRVANPRKLRAAGTLPAHFEAYCTELAS